MHTKVKEGNEQETARGASLRELQRFFFEHDQYQGYANLRRIPGEDGTALWTILKEAEVESQLEKRAGTRRMEVGSDMTAPGNDLNASGAAEKEAQLRAELDASRAETEAARREWQFQTQSALVTEQRNDAAAFDTAASDAAAAAKGLNDNAHGIDRFGYRVNCPNTPHILQPSPEPLTEPNTESYRVTPEALQPSLWKRCGALHRNSPLPAPPNQPTTQTVQSPLTNVCSFICSP